VPGSRAGWLLFARTPSCPSHPVSDYHRPQRLGRPTRQLVESAPASTCARARCMLQQHLASTPSAAPPAPRQAAGRLAPAWRSLPVACLFCARMTRHDGTSRISCSAPLNCGAAVACLRVSPSPPSPGGPAPTRGFARGEAEPATVPGLGLRAACQEERQRRHTGSAWGLGRRMRRPAKRHAPQSAARATQSRRSPAVKHAGGTRSAARVAVCARHLGGGCTLAQSRSNHWTGPGANGRGCGEKQWRDA
jgi:hypothetical protein